MKYIVQVLRSFPKYGPRAGWGLKNCFFLIMAITLERMILETEFFLKTENDIILYTGLGVIQTLDQWPGGALETVFFYMAITLERRNLKFVL